MSGFAAARALVLSRWQEARRAFTSSEFDAFSDVASPAGRRLTLVLVGALAVSGGLVGTLALLPYAGRLDMPVSTTLLVGGSIVALGAGAFLLPERTPMLALDAIIAGVIGIITVAVSYGTGRVAGDTVLFYIWAAVGISFLRPRGAALAHFVLIAIASGIVFALDDTFPDPWFWWGVILMSLAVIWHSIGWLVGRARRMAVNERAARAAAEAAKAALETASEQKSRFLATMSHELRTPLNAILGFAQMLQRGGAGPLAERQAEYVDDIADSGRHLVSLIDDALDDAIVESGEYGLHVEPVDLGALVEEAVTLVRARAVERRLEVRVDAAGGASVPLDERKIKQVLVNLLSNAVKFTPEGGSISVTVLVRHRDIEIGVADTGPGIDPSDHDAIFEEFQQASTTASGSEGTGLGLAVARRFVELHGGHIWVESTPGSGARFAFTIPTAVADSGRGHDPRRFDTARGPDPTSTRFVSVRDLTSRARFLAGAVGAGCGLGALVVETPGISTTYLTVGAVAGAGVVLLLTVALRIFRSRALAFIALAVSFASTLVTAVGFYVLGPAAPAAAMVWMGEAFYVRLLFMKLGVRGAESHLVIVAVVTAVVYGIQPGNEAPVAQWLAVVSTVWVGSFLVGWLIRRLQDLADAERSSAHEAGRTAAALAETSRHKSEFLAGMSHELRTPLNAIIGFGEALERGIAGPMSDHQLTYVDSIVSSGRDLLGLINDVLDLAKIDAGRLLLDRSQVSVRDLVDDAVSQVGAEGRAGAVAISVEVAPELEVHADPVRLAQALRSVIENSIKFSPPGALVAVSATTDARGTQIAVADMGPGVDPADVELMFEAFESRDPDPSRAGDGLGLGLALARRITELHGGRITVDSTPGVGTTVRVAVPHGPPPGSALTSQAASAATT